MNRGSLLRIVVRLAIVGGVAAAVAGVGGATVSHGASNVYTWPGAKMLTVEINPAGAGWVRSTPYLIDCPLECVRPWDTGAIVQLQVGGATKGYRFNGWSGDVGADCEAPSAAREPAGGPAAGGDEGGDEGGEDEGGEDEGGDEGGEDELRVTAFTLGSVFPLATAGEGVCVVTMDADRTIVANFSGRFRP